MVDSSDDVAMPFQSQAVVSSFTVSNGLVDLKRAAAFYDRIVILNFDIFEPKLEEAMGPDLQYLSERGLIDVRDVDVLSNLTKDHAGIDYAKRIQSGLTSALFSEESVRLKSHEACANGMARLQAAVLQEAEKREHFTPIVSGRKYVPSLNRSAQFYNQDPLPRDDELEELLPVRATATRVMFDQLVVPAREMPWEDIFQLRNDANTGLYATRLRILLQKLSNEDDRRHVEDLIRSEFADFEQQLKTFKSKRRKVAVQWILPWADLANGLIKALAFAKPSEAITPFLKAKEEKLSLNAAEADLKKNPYYLIEHIRSRLT